MWFKTTINEDKLTECLNSLYKCIPYLYVLLHVWLFLPRKMCPGKASEFASICGIHFSFRLYIDMIITNDLKWNVHRCSYVFSSFSSYEMNLFIEHYKWGGATSDERWHHRILPYSGGSWCGHRHDYLRLLHMEFYRLHGSESSNISKYHCCLHVE